VIEIEKTFLVKTLPDLTKISPEKILQGYLSPSPSPLRIRQRDSKFEITKKLPLNPNDFSSAEEINIPLTEFEFNQLWSLTQRSLEKLRYQIPLENNLIAELDIYQGQLAGLIVVEVEFPSTQDMNKFIPPSWFGHDVTQEEFSANSFLAGKSFDQIKPLISKYE
jgi:CYTH domain-containing protein